MSQDVNNECIFVAKGLTIELNKNINVLDCY